MVVQLNKLQPNKLNDPIRLQVFVVLCILASFAYEAAFHPIKYVFRNGG